MLLYIDLNVIIYVSISKLKGLIKYGEEHKIHTTIFQQNILNRNKKKYLTC